MPATFVLLSFEGPDPYSNAGGLGSRVTDLSTELAGMGYQTHLFFVGHPALPGHEVQQGGRLHLHRWCQWISQHHPRGVYDGEQGKVWDWERSLPEWLAANVLEPEIAAGNSVVVMAEEWHTARSVIALRQLVDRNGWQDQVVLLWNANNPYGFDQVPWQELRAAAAITTVSRYMRTLMTAYGVEARVLPNGITDEWFRPHDGLGQQVLREMVGDRMSLTKVARWDPDKGWSQTMHAVGIMKRLGMKPLLFARGGLESYGHHVLRQAQDAGLNVKHAGWEGLGIAALANGVNQAREADVVVFERPLTFEQRKALYGGTSAVLANSDREPFGLVGLETMASGGVAMVGCSGEDYATAGHDSISLQTRDPWEIVHSVAALQDSPVRARTLRDVARRSAANYTWSSVIKRSLLPALEMLGVSGLRAAAREVTVFQASPETSADCERGEEVASKSGYGNEALAEAV